MAEQSLKEKTAKGLFWGGLSNGVQQLLNLFFGIFLSRILNAEDYGMVGMLSIFSLIAGSLQESGFTAALANKRDISHKDYNAVFWFSTGLSACLYLILFLCAVCHKGFCLLHQIIHWVASVISTDFWNNAVGTVLVAPFRNL